MLLPAIPAHDFRDRVLDDVSTDDLDGEMLPRLPTTTLVTFKRPACRKHDRRDPLPGQPHRLVASCDEPSNNYEVEQRRFAPAHQPFVQHAEIDSGS